MSKDRGGIFQGAAIRSPRDCVPRHRSPTRSLVTQDSSARLSSGCDLWKSVGTYPRITVWISIPARGIRFGRRKTYGISLAGLAGEWVCANDECVLQQPFTIVPPLQKLPPAVIAQIHVVSFFEEEIWNSTLFLCCLYFFQTRSFSFFSLDISVSKVTRSSVRGCCELARANKRFDFWLSRIYIRFENFKAHKIFQSKPCVHFWLRYLKADFLCVVDSLHPRFQHKLLRTRET